MCHLWILKRENWCSKDREADARCMPYIYFPFSNLSLRCRSFDNVLARIKFGAWWPYRGTGAPPAWLTPLGSRLHPTVAMKDSPMGFRSAHGPAYIGPFHGNPPPMLPSPVACAAYDLPDPRGIHPMAGACARRCARRAPNFFPLVANWHSALQQHFPVPPVAAVLQIPEDQKWSTIAYRSRTF